MTVQSELRAIAERNIKYMQRRDYAPSMGGYDCARLLELVPEWLEAEAEDCRRKARSNHTNHQTTDETIFYVIAENCERLAREWRKIVGSLNASSK